MKIRMNWRLASRLSVVTFAILVVIVVTIIQQRSTSNAGRVNATSATSQGTNLGGTPAPGFTLTDQNGQTVSLSQFKGRPVVLTFMYTHCPDVCPLMAEHLHSTMLDLGNDAQKVTVLAISTDPARDDQAAAQTFTRQHNMQDYWHFLIGSQTQLSPVWTSYSVYAQAQQQNINHTSVIYVIDQQGHERLLLGNDFTPSQLAAELRTLL